jgi:hypothetical protein
MLVPVPLVALVEEVYPELALGALGAVDDRLAGSSSSTVR